MEFGIHSPIKSGQGSLPLNQDDSLSIGVRHTLSFQKWPRKSAPEPRHHTSQMRMELGTHSPFKSGQGSLPLYQDDSFFIGVRHTLSFQKWPGKSAPEPRRHTSQMRMELGTHSPFKSGQGSLPLNQDDSFFIGVRHTLSFQKWPGMPAPEPR